MNNIKTLIQATNINIANCDENIKEEKEQKGIYKQVLKHAYASCKHEFKTVPYHAGYVEQCKHCGYEGIA